MIKWSPEYMLNHPKIGKEHQKLFEMLNAFYQGIKDGSSKKKLAELIKGLLDYSNIHFANEEAYMESIGFPDIDKHKEEHEAFTRKATDFYNKYTSGKMILSLEVTNFIKDWISHHIKNEDRQYAAFAEL